MSQSRRILADRRKLEICSAYRAGERQAAIAQRFGCGQATVSRIVTGVFGRTPDAERTKRSTEGALASRAETQAERIANGTFNIERRGDVIFATVSGVRFTFDACDEDLLRQHLWRVYVDHRLGRQVGAERAN